jgi:hypothetical protein
MDFTNVGASSNTAGVWFVATGTTPTSWGANEGLVDILFWNAGTPIATVLENTIGNIWWTYNTNGTYLITSDGLFTSDKTFSILGPQTQNTPDTLYFQLTPDTQYVCTLYTMYNGATVDQLLSNNSIEIRVYN